MTTGEGTDARVVVAVGFGFLRALGRFVVLPLGLVLRMAWRRHLGALKRTLPHAEWAAARGDALTIDIAGGGQLSFRPADVRTARITVFEDRRRGFAQSEEWWLLEGTHGDGERVRVLDAEPPPGAERPLAHACAALWEHGKLRGRRDVDVSRIGLADLLLLAVWAAALTGLLGCFGWPAAGLAGVGP